MDHSIYYWVGGLLFSIWEAWLGKTKFGSSWGMVGVGLKRLAQLTGARPPDPPTPPPDETKQ